MTSMTADFPPQDATEIGSALAETYSVAALANGGYLAGPDGQTVASQMREPQLREALLLGRCGGTNDVNAFYQRDEEPAEEWMTRRECTIAQYCAPCPVAAACLELALRYPEHPRDLAVRGGTTEEMQLTLGKADHERLAKACALDARPAEQRVERLRAAREVKRLTQSHIGLSVKPDVRKTNHTELKAAVAHHERLQGEYRRVTGWAA
ncbi:WhiB family transcriptional regulator [Streptomyces sp. NBC_00582]|uniref:WhiB family transcriptional regulator n=1 Tax=Streptomyces sp. NBC_00582 TaxID=2975783 RepID=UPI002E822D0D|nr:WhiB family transcriptional regulator [Streptomyces sp. NBC_00582]WUB68574.1 WhiB family transcriptional regulator [Streptomyces sp. NBC_00582]